VTLSDEVFQALVKAILSGEIEPGARLDEPSICRKFGVSRTPIREALRRLSGTGLVEVTPRKGVTVARIDVEQLNNMFEALGEFEGTLCEIKCCPNEYAGEEATRGSQRIPTEENCRWRQRFRSNEQ